MFVYTVCKFYQVYFITGDYVCQHETTSAAGALVLNSQVMDCPNSKLLDSVYIMDSKFYCYDGNYCSKKYKR